MEKEEIKRKLSSVINTFLLRYYAEFKVPIISDYAAETKEINEDIKNILIKNYIIN